MLFQGQEFGVSSPWLYFADHEGDLGRQVPKGRAEFLSQFPSIAAAIRHIPDPWTRPHSSAASSTRPSATCRRRSTRCIGNCWPSAGRTRYFAASNPARWTALFDPQAFVLRFFDGAAGDRLLLLNLGADVRLDPAPEPLLAPPRGGAWRLVGQAGAALRRPRHRAGP